jgi:multiple sugar transport system substrate-binding protein
MKRKIIKGIQVMKKRLILILPLVLLSIFSGCSTDQTTENIQKKEPVILKIAWWGEQPRHDTTKKVIELFEKENPDIKIEYEYSNWDEYWKRLAPMAAANQLPDIIQMDLLYLQSYSNNDLLEDLTPYIHNHLIDTKYIDNKILSGGKISNKLYGFPLGINAPVVITDNYLISGAGVSIPKQEWTWEDFEKTASEIHQGSNIYGTNGMKPPDVFFAYYLQSQGKSLYNSDGTSLGYDDDQLFIAYFNMQLRLLDQGALPRVDITEQISSIQDQPLVNQKAAMTWAYSNQFYSFSETAKRPLEILPPPENARHTNITVKPSLLFSITKGSKHKNQAAKFINFFVNNIEANRVLKGERGVPVSSYIAAKIKKDLPEAQKKIFDYVMKVENENNKIEKAYPLGSAKVVNDLNDISNQILFKKITPEEGAKIFRTKANNILSNNKKG